MGEGVIENFLFVSLALPWLMPEYTPAVYGVNIEIAVLCRKL